MDRGKFYEHLRKKDVNIFGTSLSQKQVEGIDALLNSAAGLSIPHAAHVLAECYHETGGGMYPVKETVQAYHKSKNPTDEQVIARLNRAWSQGALNWVKKPYWRDGWFGRGLIQITHKINYEKMSAVVGRDLIHDPSAALDVEISAEIAVEGCRRGIFTGKKLADYDIAPAGFNHRGARATVNGDTKINGDKVAKYAAAFEVALAVGGWSKKTEAPSIAEPKPKPKTGWSAIIAAFLKLIGGRK